jgi:hypothetical protein
MNTIKASHFTGILPKQNSGPVQRNGITASKLAGKNIRQLAKIHRRALRRGWITEKIAANAPENSITWNAAVATTHALRSLKINVALEAERRINNPTAALKRELAAARAAQADLEIVAQ